MIAEIDLARNLVWSAIVEYVSSWLASILFKSI